MEEIGIYAGSRGQKKERKRNFCRPSVSFFRALTRFQYRKWHWLPLSPLARNFRLQASSAPSGGTHFCLQRWRQREERSDRRPLRGRSWSKNRIHRMHRQLRRGNQNRRWRWSFGNHNSDIRSRQCRCFKRLKSTICCTSCTLFENTLFNCF